MVSSHFTALDASMRELKRVYLDAGLAAPVPTIDHQEMARAFVVFAHAELEWYVEEALRQLADTLLAASTVGQYSKASFTLLTFTGLKPTHGGTVLSSGRKKSPRQLATRFGEGYNAVIQVLNANMGVREKHLAAMGVPLGLDANVIDNTWLNELDAFCSFRGAYVHMSRLTQRASFQSVNPSDMWKKCEYLVWTNPAVAATGTINSFESFDAWIESEKASVGTTVQSASLRLGVIRMLGVVARVLLNRKDSVEDD